MTPVFIPSVYHLLDQVLVPPVKSLQSSLPPHSFGVVGVSFLSFGQYAPYPMDFSVFTKEVLSAKLLRTDVPHSHAMLFLW
jgi:hypothetical protein